MSMYEKSYRLSEELGNTPGMVSALGNIATVHAKLRRYDTAIAMYRRCIRLYEQLGDSVRIARTLMNIGECDRLQGKLDEATDMFERSLKLKEMLGDRAGIESVLIDIGAVHEQSGHYDLAFEYATRVLSLAKESGMKEHIKIALANLSSISAARKDYEKAYAFHKQYMEIKDSLVNEANVKSINELQARYDAAEREKTIALLGKQKEVQALELEKNQKELSIRTLESGRNRERAELLARQHQVEVLELDRRGEQLELRTKDLQLERVHREKREREMTMLAREKEQQATLAGRQRTAMFVGLALSSIIGFLGVKRVQARRVEASLRAESAEYKAEAAEAEMHKTQAEAERGRREAHQEFSRQLIASQEDERSRIAAELHDQLGQDLIVIRNSIIATLSEGRGTERLAEAEQTAGLVLENVRRLARDLRPFQLDRYGLTNALNAMIARVGKSCATRFTAEIDPLDGFIDKTGEIMLYRIVQEGVNNIIRHADAREATVRIVRSEEMLELVIEDDGKGIASAEVHDFGIHGMRQRVELLGGTMRVDSHPGRTKLLFSLPVQPPTEQYTPTGRKDDPGE
jgi:signal transduction histidine kinase